MIIYLKTYQLNSKKESTRDISCRFFMAHQKIGLMEKISPIKLYTKVKKNIEKNTNIRYNLIDEN